MRLLLFAFCFISQVNFGQNNKLRFDSLHFNKIILPIADSLAEIKTVVVNDPICFPDLQKQWNYYNDLSENATSSELFELLKIKSPIIKAYSFALLTLKEQDSTIFLLIKEYFYNRTIIAVNMNCSFREITLIDFFIALYRNQNNYERSQEYPFTFRYVDSLLLYDDNAPFSSRYDALLHYKPISYDYEKIHKIVKSNFSPIATVALAKFRNNNDITLIMDLLNNNLHYGLLAIEAFPDNCFLESLIKVYLSESKNKYIDGVRLSILYFCLIQYNESQVKELIRNNLRRLRGYKKKQHEFYLNQAIEKYKSWYYYDLFTTR